MTTEATIHGRRMRLLGSREAPGVLLDTWQDLDQPPGSVTRVGVVALITDGSGGVENPFLPWGDTYAVGYTRNPSGDPVERFLEAVRQERERSRERLSAPLEMRAVYQPPTYAEPREGPGRWVILYADAGEVELGYLWTGDNGGLGFVPSSDRGIVRTPDFYMGFSAAKAAGTPAGDVFDHYAGRSSLGLSAGPVTEGDLDAFPG